MPPKADPCAKRLSTLELLKPYDHVSLPACGGTRNGHADMTAKIEVETGSDNVFADIGLPHADAHLIKAKLVFKIDALMKERNLKQVQAAELFGVTQPDISKMLRGDFRQFSVERLMRFLVALGQNVEISVTPNNGKSAAPAMTVT